MKWVHTLLAVGLAASSIACRPTGYGPATDRTRFVSVRENETHSVLYTLHELVYRPATGWRAFPDGGIPLYTEDQNVVGVLQAGAAKPRTLCSRRNTDWQHGQGELNVHGFKGHVAIVTEAGQRRDNYLADIRYYALDTSTGTLARLPLKEDLAARGRDVGYFYLLDAAGTLLFVTPPPGEARVDSATDEIWLRRPSGDYVRVAKGADIYRQSADEVIFWEIEQRKLWAYDVTTGMRHVIERYAPAPEARPQREVRLAGDGRALQVWTRHDDTWNREETLLTLDQARRR